MAVDWQKNLTVSDFILHYTELFQFGVTCAANYAKCDIQSAEDICSVVLMKVYERLQDGLTIENTKAFILTSVRNKYIESFRLKKQAALFAKYSSTIEKASLEGPAPAPKHEPFQIDSFFQDSSETGKALKAFLNDKEFRVLQFEYSDQSSKYRNVGEAIATEPLLQGFNEAGYYQLKRRAEAKFKIFIFQIRPSLLGGVAAIREKLPYFLEKIIAIQFNSADRKEMDDIHRLVLVKSPADAIPFGNLAQSDKIRQEYRDEVGQAMRRILENQSFTMEEKSRLIRWNQGISSKIIQEDIELFRQVVLAGHKIPQGRHKNIERVCQALIGYFTPEDFFVGVEKNIF